MEQRLFPEDTIFTVTNLTALLKDILETSFSTVTLEGEISNFKQNSSGHLYFTLKDEQAQISAVMFRSRTYSLNFNPKDGIKVRCTGSISVYAPQGKYQIIVTKMEVSGQGNILQILEERKKKLAALGLFDSARKVPVPVFPKTIGIVTSPTGAALRDILQIVKRRNKTVNVVIFPAMVQGAGAELTIANQIKTANEFKMCDTLIVGRGGGSLEDLLPFSEECVVKAIAESKIPVISAVGHEIDWALSDYAADKRAPTPSAAAELAVPNLSDIQNDIHWYSTELYNSISARIKQMKLMIKSFNPENLEIKFRTIEQPLLMRLEKARDSLSENILQRIKDVRTHIRECVNILEGASPKTILARGYSMVQDKNGKIIRSSKDISAGAEIKIFPAQGKITANVTETED